MERKKQRMIIGEALKGLRIRKGLTKYRVAKNGGIAIGQVTMVEKGENNYTLDILLSYLSIVDINLSTLIEAHTRK